MERLKLALEIMGSDSDMIPLSVSEWPQDKKINYKRLERQCRKLNDEELEAFVCGEVEEISQLKNKYKLRYLNDFLNRAFDGDLSKYFFWSI